MEGDKVVDSRARDRIFALKNTIQQARDFADVVLKLVAVRDEIGFAVRSNKVTTADIQIIDSCMTDIQLLLNELAHGVMTTNNDNGLEHYQYNPAGQYQELESTVRKLRDELGEIMRGI